MVTADQSLEYQQNLKGRKLALVVLSTNHIAVLEKHPERLVAAIDVFQASAAGARGGFGKRSSAVVSSDAGAAIRLGASSRGTRCARTLRSAQTGWQLLTTWTDELET